MNEVRKLYVDLLKGITLGAFGAVVFRDSGWGESIAFTIIGVFALATARYLAKGDE